MRSIMRGEAQSKHARSGRLELCVMMSLTSFGGPGGCGVCVGSSSSRSLVWGFAALTSSLFRLRCRASLDFVWLFVVVSVCGSGVFAGS